MYRAPPPCDHSNFEWIIREHEGCQEKTPNLQWQYKDYWKRCLECGFLCGIRPVGFFGAYRELGWKPHDRAVEAYETNS